MLVYPQGDLFTAKYCSESVTYFSLITYHAGLPTGRFIYSTILR